MRIVYIAFWLLLVILGIVFAVLNPGNVQLNYYFGSFQLAISLVIALAMLVGAVLGMLASLFVVLRTRHEMRKLKRQAEMAEKEVLNLRAIPIQDRH